MTYSNRMKRPFVDAPQVERCRRNITLRDGSSAQCGRRASPSKQAADQFCWQHQLARCEHGVIDNGSCHRCFATFDARRVIERFGPVGS
jgi:hypothetical protein